MKTLFAIVPTIGLLAVSAMAQPTVSLVLNAASSSYPPLPNSSIAQGSYFTIYGNNFGPASSVCAATPATCYWNPYPLPIVVSNTSAQVTIGTNTPVDVYIQFAEQLNGYSQINAVMPSNAPTGTGTITVSYNGTPSTPVPITVVASSFGTFAWNEVGSGPGIFTDAVSYALLTPFASTKPGNYVTIWGTGLGPVPDAAAEKAAKPAQTNLCSSSTSCPVTVWVGGIQATVTYAGRSPYTAEDQIDFIVPPGPLGCYVQVAVQIGSVISNFTSMAVDPSGATCSDIDGIDYADISSIVASKGQANIGNIIAMSNFLSVNIPLIGVKNQPWDNDTITGEIGTFTARTLDTFQGFSLSPSVGNCTVTPFLDVPPPADPGLSLSFLDAGSSLSINGPNGTQPVPENTSGTLYQGLVGGETIKDLETLLTLGTCPADSTDKCAPFFLNSSYAITTGPFTLTGSGGSAVGALSAPISVSSAAASFKWTNQSSITANPIPLDAPLTITWSGGDPNGFVDITAVASTLASGIPTDSTPGLLAECIVQASKGTFTIPAYVLSALPSTTNSTALVPPGELLVGPASGAVKVTPPSGLDELYVVYHFIQGTNVAWQ